MPMPDLDRLPSVSDAAIDPAEDAALEISKRFAQLLRDKIIRRSKQSGRVMVRAIGYRVIVFQLLLDPPQSRWSLNSYARELNCSGAWLSRIGLEFADEIGMAAHWQRLVARSTYARRARTAHRTVAEAKAATSSTSLRNREAIGSARAGVPPTP